MDQKTASATERICRNRVRVVFYWDDPLTSLVGRIERAVIKGRGDGERACHSELLRGNPPP